LGSSYQEGRVGIQLSRGEGWDPVIKRGGLGSSYQEGRVGDTVIKKGGLGYSYQEGRVGIQLSRGDGWDTIIKRGGLGYRIVSQPSPLDNCIPTLPS
jgi:hypothetical protein